MAIEPVFSTSGFLKIDREAVRGNVSATEMLQQLNIPLLCPECLKRHWPEPPQNENDRNDEAFVAPEFVEEWRRMKGKQ